jgi:hypothetical protein
VRVFLSYASEDRAIAEPIALSLRGAGYTVFYDRDNLPAGDSYNTRIAEAVADADLFIFLMSPRALESGRYTLTEMTLARMKWPSPARRVLTVQIAPVDRAAVPAYLAASTFLQPLGNAAADVTHKVNLYFGRPRTSVAVTTMAVIGTLSGLLSGLSLFNLLDGSISMSGVRDILATAAPLDRARIVAQGMLPGVLLGAAIGAGLWRWAGRRTSAIFISIVCVALGSAFAFVTMAWFGRPPRDGDFALILHLGRYALLGFTIAAACLLALSICCVKFRTVELAALVLLAGTLGGLIAMTGLTRTSDLGRLNTDLAWLFPIAMAFWQALVCATVGYGFSREQRPQ